MEKTITKNLDLTTFQFPNVTGLDSAFSTFDTIPALLNEAKLRGFYNDSNPYCKLFSKLFFSGGKIVFKQDLDPEFKKRAFPYLRSFMGSFSPKHEHKEAICAMLLSELAEPELDNL
jgi:hypothetical protein